MYKLPQIPPSSVMFLLAMARAKRILDGISGEVPATDYDGLPDESKIAQVDLSESES